MTITTLDGALAGMQVLQPFFKAISPTLVSGRFDSPWYRAGYPGAGAADTSTATGVARSSTSALVNGQIPFYDPGGGTNSYLARFSLSSGTNPCSGILVDRLWDCGAQSNASAISITSTGSQTINSLAWPARDNTGTTNGAGVIIGVEVSTATGAGTPVITLTYTNSANVGSHTATTIQATSASSAIGAFYAIGLQAGDVGVRSVQSIQANATWTSGQYVLVAYRIIALVDVVVAAAAGIVDLITGGFPQLFNGSVPMLLVMPNATTASIYSGTMIATQG